MKPQIVAAFVLGYMAGLASMYNLVHLRDLKLQRQTWGGCFDANTSQASPPYIPSAPLPLRSAMLGNGTWEYANMSAESPEGQEAGGRDWKNWTIAQESASRWRGGGGGGVEVGSDGGGGLLSEDLPVGKGGRRQEEKEEQEDSIEFRLQLPAGTRGVIINVGSNKDPIQPPADNSSIVVIAVEPILTTAMRIKRPQHGRLLVIGGVAIASGPPRFQMFREYFRDGLSSSLAKVIDERLRQLFSQEEGRLWPVAVLPLKILLRSIPSSVDILHVMTDMQGFDLDAIKSAGDEIRRTPSLMTEVSCGGKVAYEGVKNDLALDWMDYMRTQGFRLTNGNQLQGPSATNRDMRHGIDCLAKASARTPGLSEGNAVWRRFPL